MIKWNVKCILHVWICLQTMLWALTAAAVCLLCVWQLLFTGRSAELSDLPSASLTHTYTQIQRSKDRHWVTVCAPTLSMLFTLCFSVRLFNGHWDKLRLWLLFLCHWADYQTIIFFVSVAWIIKAVVKAAILLFSITSLLLKSYQ